MVLSVVQLAAWSGRLPTQPLFSHLPGLAVFGVGMLAGALAVLVSGWLRDHPQSGRSRPVPVSRPAGPAGPVRSAPALLAAPVPAPRVTALPGRSVPAPAPTPRLALAPRLAPVPEPAGHVPAAGPDAGSDPGLRIGLLGALTVNGQAGALVPAQSQLIVALALHPAGLPNRRLRVLLGADAAHPKPPDSLRQLIARTRRALGRAPDGREWIEHLGHGLYALHPRAQVDWREFETLTGQGIAGSEAAPLTAALEMVRGEPFTECYYWWLEPALTESVSARIVIAAERLAGLNLAAGDPAAAVRAARIGLTADPAAEQLWRLMMRAEHAAGNLAGVREAMGRCLNVVAEVAADGQPDSATLAVYGELLAR
ncbi:MAG: BTAD domain-containing putative transcriptional regulator [Streptosporangiaceae bacterium]